MLLLPPSEGKWGKMCQQLHSIVNDNCPVVDSFIELENMLCLSLLSPYSSFSVCLFVPALSCLALPCLALQSQLQPKLLSAVTKLTLPLYVTTTERKERKKERKEGEVKEKMEKGDKTLFLFFSFFLKRRSKETSNRKDFGDGPTLRCAVV